MMTTHLDTGQVVNANANNQPQQQISQQPQLPLHSQHFSNDISANTTNQHTNPHLNNGLPVQLKVKLLDSNPQPKRTGRKPNTSEPISRRQAMNRIAQRVFRERKEFYIKGLETRVVKLKESQLRHSEIYQQLTYYLIKLEDLNIKLKQSIITQNGINSHLQINAANGSYFPNMMDMQALNSFSNLNFNQQTNEPAGADNGNGNAMHSYDQMDPNQKVNNNSMHNNFSMNPNLPYQLSSRTPSLEYVPQLTNYRSFAEMANPQLQPTNSNTHDSANNIDVDLGFSIEELTSIMNPIHTASVEELLKVKGFHQQLKENVKNATFSFDNLQEGLTKKLWLDKMAEYLKFYQMET